MKQTCPLILASSSQIRQQVLRAAGLEFSVQKPKIDETALKKTMSDLSPAALALFLAEAKALAANHGKQALVIGSDQLLEIDNTALDKAKTLQQARDRLWNLRGRAHFLTGATVLARNGKIVWRDQQRSKLVMRDFSAEDLDGYLQKTGTRILASVGCYELEKEGISLFSSMQGDHNAMKKTG